MLKDLVHQILTFSRRVDQELKPLDVSLIVKEVVKMLRASLPSTIENRKQNCSGNLCKVLADPTQIHQVVMNICTNAAHAIGDKYRCTLKISIDTIEISQEALIDFRDLSRNWYSISQWNLLILEKVFQKIFFMYVFDPYFTTKEYGEGTGLGSIGCTWYC